MDEDEDECSCCVLRVLRAFVVKNRIYAGKAADFNVVVRILTLMVNTFFGFGV